MAYRGFGIWMPSRARVTMGCRGGGGAVVDDGSGGAGVEDTVGLSSFGAEGADSGVCGAGDAPGADCADAAVGVDDGAAESPEFGGAGGGPEAADG